MTAILEKQKYATIMFLAVVPPEAGRLLGRGGVTTSGGPARSQPKRGKSVVTRPRRRTRRLQCDVSGATLTEIEGPGKSGGAYGGEGEAGERAGGRDPGGGGEEGQFVCDDRRGRPGRGDVKSIATIFLSPGILSFPFLLLQPFSPRHEPAGRWCLPKPGGCWGGEA